VDWNHYFTIGSVFDFLIKSKLLCMDICRVFVYMLMSDASLKQRIPCIIRISIFGAFSAGKKCALYTGKYGTFRQWMVEIVIIVPPNLPYYLCFINLYVWFSFFLCGLEYYRDYHHWEKREITITFRVYLRQPISCWHVTSSI